jgi:hypothetical protein
MKVPDIDQPLRLTWDFGVAYVVIAAPTLWLAHPWNWGMPFYSEAIGFVLLPFIAMMLIYCPALFVASLIKDFSRQKRIVIRLSMAMGVFGGIMILTWVLLDFERVPSIVGSIAAVIAHQILYPKDKQRANKAAEPTRTTGTPPANAGDRASVARGSL